MFYLWPSVCWSLTDPSWPISCCTNNEWHTRHRSQTETLIKKYIWCSWDSLSSAMMAEATEKSSKKIKNSLFPDPGLVSVSRWGEFKNWDGIRPASLRPWEQSPAISEVMCCWGFRLRLWASWGSRWLGGGQRPRCFCKTWATAEEEKVHEAPQSDGGGQTVWCLLQVIGPSRPENPHFCFSSFCCFASCFCY